MSGWFVTANDIKEWTATNKRRAEEVLPLLVKRLAFASCKPKLIDFPSGDAVAVGGWDGILDVEEGNEFIPKGKSGWELGTNSNVIKKADSDYDKRTKSPDPLALDESTFVFVTSRLWIKRDTWVRNKKASGKWKDIRGINASSLEAWLTRCPAVHRWFASIIGKRTGHLWDLDQTWRALSNLTELVLTPELFRNSREAEKEKLNNELRGKASILRIKAQSRLEAYGFILASLQLRDEFVARVLIVKNQEAWDWVIDFDQPLILIPDGFIPTALGSAVSKGHHVVIAIDERDSASASIKLNRMPREERIKAIQSLGLSKEQAEEVYSDTKGYLEPILRHKLLRPRELLLPQWVYAGNSDILFSALFATEWNAANDKDKEIMASLSGQKYQEFQRAIVDLSKEADPPVRLVGTIWQVISKVDMWLSIAPRISKAHLDRLGVAAKLVLSDPDPSFDLKSDERYMASLKGAVPLYSRHIKTGITDSLALLAAYGDDYVNQAGGEKPSDLVRWWIRELFEESVEAKVWYSLDGCLPSLAEAAPDELLHALERAMEGDRPPIAAIFLAEGNGIFGGCPHSNLLWSLELISWDTRHLAKVSTSLARLSAIDPGGKYSNRPFNSLVEICLGWINNTRATHKQRLQVIENVLLVQYPDISWKLMVALLINKTTTSTGVHKPTYREWAEGVKTTVTNRDYFEYIGAIVDILFREVDHNPGERLLDLIGSFDSYDLGQQKILVDRLLSFNVSVVEPNNREKIVKKLRGILSHHRAFPDAPWSWPEELLDKLEIIYHRFKFDDVVKKNIYLFNDHWPDLIEPIKRKGVDHEEREKLITNKRIEAIEAIFNARGIKGIEDLSGEGDYPGLAGYALFRSCVSEQVLPRVVDWLGKGGKLDLVAQSYIYARSAEDWNRAVVILDTNPEWETSKTVSFLWGLPVNGRTFDLVEKQDEEVQRKYWSGLNYYFLPPNERDKAGYVARKLLENNRPLAAVDAAAQSLSGKGDRKDLDSSLVASILIRIATEPSDIERVSIQNVRYDILRAIEFLQDRAELPAEEMSQIEWAYLSIFRFEDVKPRYLSEKVSRDPAFFVQLVVWAFRRDEGKAPEEDLSDEIVKRRAETAWELLDTISVLPGSDGASIDAGKLHEWVDCARQMLKETGRLKIGDDRIGSYLSRCSEGSDGIWPHEAVRSVIESVRSVDLDRAIYIGKRNLRGVTTRSPFAGGEQERTLAAIYAENAQKIELVSPRTADILWSLSKGYEGDALREDREVELRE
jgi:hypothetical protein